MTLRGRFFWKVLVGHVALVAVVLGVAVFALVDALEGLGAERAARRQFGLTEQLAALVEGRLDRAHETELRRITSSFGGSASERVRITLILANGVVVADSQGDPERMDSHAGRPEVIAALANGLGESVRWSRTIVRELHYTARRVGPAEKPEGVVRTAVAVRTLAAQASALRRMAWRIVVVGAFAASALAIGLAATWSGRIRRLTAAARRLARGDMDTTLDTSGRDEIALLARSLNRLRERYRLQLEAADRQRHTVESILAELGEGIVVVDSKGRIVLLNSAARRMLAVKDAEEPTRRHRDEWTVERCIANHDLQQLLIEPLIAGSAAPQRGTEIRLEHPDATEDRTVLAHVAPLAVAEPNDAIRRAETNEPAPGAGRMLVLTDVSELTRTVKMRTDFVANASHELRTPLSAIRGAVETLLRMDLVAGNTAAPRFLEMIGRHGQRLEALANDLLALARIEGGPNRFQPAPLDLLSFRSELHDRWHHATCRKQLDWKIEVPTGCHSFVVNAYLFNLVLDNLIENAVKFTEPGGRVVVSIDQADTELVARVCDTGCGIPEREQRRVFERFYQAKQRGGSSMGSGSVRGTGLGLSIVRHAVAAMHGSVELESTVGRGTTITVRIPHPPRDTSQRER